MNVSQSLINLSESMRGVLVKIVPMSVLRGVKDFLIDKSLQKQLRNCRIIPYEPGHYEEGINLIGGIRMEIGLGQSCRLLANELEHTGLPYTIKDYVLDAGVNMRKQDTTWEHKISDALPYDINIMHIEPPDMAFGYSDLRKETWDYRYNIGFWLWELEEFPKSWEKSLMLVDEVWTPSEFVSRCVRTVTNKPVYTIPYCVEAPTDDAYDREYFKLPTKRFLYLAMYDTNSTIARKNPAGAVRAFQKAFGPKDNRVGLVLKMNNPTLEDKQELSKIIGAYTNIYCIDEVMDKVVVNSLIRCADVFVSLHRAEGFGLVMAEAMLNGTVCIATNWSSNTEFMNPDVACMVDYEFTVLKKTQGTYKKGAKWAEANIDTAAAYMKRLLEDRAYYEGLSKAAKEYTAVKLGMENAVSGITERIAQIRKEHQKS